MIDSKQFYRNLSEKVLVQASTMPLKDLIENLESLAHMMHSPMLREAANRLRNADCAMTIFEDSLFYARMYRDTTVEGANLRRILIDDAETVVSLIRNGGCQ
jgi:DNA-binding transcriptional regulator LsrR (DeoR family)